MFKSLTFLIICLMPQLVVAKLKCPSPKSTFQYDRIILDEARKQGVDAALIHAVIKQESCYDRFAVSHVGAEGLMQLMPATARRFHVKNAFIPKQNISAGAKYLAWLLKRFNGNIRFALAGYNAGEGKVDRYKGIPPFKETRNYVTRVMSNYRRFKGIPDHKNNSKQKTIMAETVLRQKTNDKKSRPLKTHISVARQRRKLLSGLALNKVKQPAKVVRSNNKRTRISSITLARKNNGYTRVNAKVFRGRINAS